MKSLTTLSLMFFFGLISIAQDITINGPTITCPNTPETYHVFTTGLFGTKLNGSIGWEVYINNVKDLNLSSGPVPCHVSSNQKDFYITIEYIDEDDNYFPGWQDIGEIELRITFVKSNSCNATQKTLDITSEVVFDPGLPTTQNNELIICSGETKTVYLDPGVPGILATPENCMYHFNWNWSAPIGWKIADTIDSGLGNSNTLSTPAEEVC